MTIHWENFEVEAWNEHLSKLPINKQREETDRMMREIREWLDAQQKELKF